MITRIHLHNIGPARDLKAEFGRRLNLVTGDNGLGKTFLLDACWYVLTKRTWADNVPFRPAAGIPKDDPPKIEYAVRGEGGKTARSHAEFQFSTQAWKGARGRPPKPGLVIYARIDGGFSVWDPARNYWLDGGDSENAGSPSERPRAYQFSKSEVWDGLSKKDDAGEKIVCNGLLRDVESWRLKNNGAFHSLRKALETLSADEKETMRIGEGVRVRVDDARDIPTLKMPYGDVPVTQAAAGMRRVLGLAYLMVWAWEEHRQAAEILRESPTKHMVLLFDEVEAHLHPKWQRVFLPSLLETARQMLPGGESDPVQIIATTHSPLVPASVETLWDGKRDRLFDFDLNGNEVELEAIPFAKHGSAEHWLSSDSFDLPSAYPVEAQKAIEEADSFMRRFPDPKEAPANEMETVHKSLLRTLGGDDEYWTYWIPYYEEGRNKS